MKEIVIKGRKIGMAVLLGLLAAYVLAFVGLLAGIANGENFIDNENLWFQESSYGEAEADGHTRGETLDRGVEVTFDASKINNLVELTGNLSLGHAHDAAVHIDILSCGHLRVETGANLQ